MTPPRSSQPEAAVHPRLKKYAPRILSALVCAAAIATSGCGYNYLTSFYGTAWVDVTAQPGDYTSYVVTIDYVSLTRSDGVVITAVATPEIVDLTQVRNIAELWSSGVGAVADGVYPSAQITIDYTTAAISVMVNGKPQAATVVDAATGSAAGTYTITVNFDPANQPNITPTFASSSAVLLNVDFDLAASGTVDTTTSPVTVRVRPFATIGMQATDARLIRVRGPLINSSTDVNTFTVDIRPFYDEANNIGSLTLFSQANTVYTINGKPYIGSAGLSTLSVLSAGTTLTAGYTTFQTDYNALNQAVAGRFNLVYVVAGSTLEDFYTEGISGDVVARNGNTVTLLGSTLFLTVYDYFVYETAPTQLLLGPGTIVTADNNSTLTGLSANDVSVGQHIIARGVYSVLGNGTVQLDSTGTSSTNTGSVRLLNTEVWGTLTAAAGGNLTMNAQTIGNWPIGDFNFAGNGTGTENPAAFQVAAGTAVLPPGVVAGDPVWVNGYTAPFASAPPDFNALAVNGESSVQLAGAQPGGGAATTPGTRGCGIGSQICNPARLQVNWTKSTTPFAALSSAGFSLDLAGAVSAVIKIGPEVIDLATAPPVTFVPTTLTPTSTFAPRYTVGNPATASTNSNSANTALATSALESFSSFPTWVSTVGKTLSASSPALQLTATGIYNRASNTFTATTIDFVL